MAKLLKIGETSGGWTRTGILQVEVHFACVTPFWYGVAWHDPMRMMSVCYPIPLNWAAWAIREVYWFLKVAPHFQNHPLYKEGFERGRKYTEQTYFYRHTLEELERQKGEWKEMDG